MIKWFGALLLLLSVLLPGVSSASGPPPTSCPAGGCTHAVALQLGQAYADYYNSLVPKPPDVARVSDESCCGGTGMAVYVRRSSDNYALAYYLYPLGDCAIGAPVNGTVDFAPYPGSVGPNDGVMCQHSCEVVLNVNIGGSGPSGSYVQSGAICPAPGTAPPLTLQPPKFSTNPNPDGSTTYCANNGAGPCVTSKPDGDPKPPPPNPATGANNSTDGHDTTTTPSTTSTTTTNTTTNNTTVTTGGGTSGGGGDSTSTTTGTGTGTSTTTTPETTSETDKKCTTGVCDVGTADGDIGGLYSSGTDSASAAYSGFIGKVKQAPAVAAVTGFFAPSSSGGACPVWHIPGNKYWGAAGFDFAFFCSSGFLAILQLAGALVLAVGAFSAFRIAMY